MTARRLSIAIWACVALMAFFICYRLGALAWHLSGHTVIETELMPAAFDMSSVSETANIAPILALAPFGEVQRLESDLVESETDLALTLHGVMVANVAARSWAAISRSGGDPTLYYTGDIIAGSTRIERIEVDKVLLRVDGALQSLSFSEDQSGTGRFNSVPDRPRSVLPPSVDTSNADAVIDHFRGEIAANPQTVLDTLGVERSSRGYLIGERAAAGLLRAGLKPGDRILSVNGKTVGDISSDRQLFEEVVAEGQARVRLERDGRSILLSFPIR